MPGRSRRHGDFQARLWLAASAPGGKDAAPLAARARTSLALGLALITVLIGATVAYDRSRRDVIAPGVRVANLAVGGLHAADAEPTTAGTLLRRLKPPL